MPIRQCNPIRNRSALAAFARRVQDVKRINAETSDVLLHYAAT